MTPLWLVPPGVGAKCRDHYDNKVIVRAANKPANTPFPSCCCRLDISYFGFDPERLDRTWSERFCWQGDNIDVSMALFAHTTRS